jgi:hypothetical protein
VSISGSSSWGQPACKAMGASSSHLEPSGTNVVVVVVGGIVVVVVVVTGIVITTLVVMGVSCIFNFCDSVLLASITGPAMLMANATNITGLEYMDLRNSFLLDRGYGKALLLG